MTIPEKTYSANDMARIYCEKCNGCGDCCHGMTDTIHMDPYDVDQFTRNLHRSFQQMLDHEIGLHVEEGMILPHLRFSHDVCPFLDTEGHCTIHAFRPGFCRLFPLGRDYDAATRTFRYFIVDAGCDMPGKVKVRISRWLGIPDLPRYEQFVADWHYFCRDVKAAIARRNDPDYTARLNQFLLTVFYLTPYAPAQDFYRLFYLRLDQARSVL